jgi:23S rRNA (adenine2030-N6)-methyltransferase
VNYRHAYHAGNFADVMKHALLVWLLRAMARKDKPFLVLDTHAGTGAYDLNAPEALRTGEAFTGIFRVLDATEPALANYLGLLGRLGLYPGSPSIAHALLRPGDRLVCCELHPEDAALLRRHFAGPRNAPENRAENGAENGAENVAVHVRDGYEALKAFLPPPERRGLILIDPPYEAPDEFTNLAAMLRAAHARFATGVFVAWYPVKHRAPVRAFHAALRESGMRDIVAAELLLREPLDPARLNGCGLVVINPPWQFEPNAQAILAALLAHLGQDEPGAAAGVTRLTDE